MIIIYCKTINCVLKLNLGIPKDILFDPQLFAVRTIDLTNNFFSYKND